MLHVPSMLTYGFLSFILAFFNKALFELANFRNSLFVIFSQLIFILISFQVLSYSRLITLPIITKNDIYTLFIPSIFYCLSTVLSLQALMKLNVAIYVVIKVSLEIEIVRKSHTNKERSLNMSPSFLVKVTIHVQPQELLQFLNYCLQSHYTSH